MMKKKQHSYWKFRKEPIGSGERAKKTLYHGEIIKEKFELGSKGFFLAERFY